VYDACLLVVNIGSLGRLEISKYISTRKTEIKQNKNNTGITSRKFEEKNLLSRINEMEKGKNDNSCVFRLCAKICRVCGATSLQLD